MNIELGLGLIGIGRQWGYKNSSIPDEPEVYSFLKNALDRRIRFFDTAPAYGKSEERLGKFLHTLDLVERKRITVATKFGEHWNDDTQNTYVDHSFDALKASIDRSLKCLGQIDILQLHKTTPEVLTKEDFHRAIEYAKSCGIYTFGASISDFESGEFVCNSEAFSSIQLPYNINNTAFDPIIDLAKQNDKLVFINRPFNMGAILYTGEGGISQEHLKVIAFKHILIKGFRGLILTGTKSIAHLEDNIRAFEMASNTLK